MAAKKTPPTPIDDPNLEDFIRELANNRTDQAALKAREADLVKVIAETLGTGSFTSIAHDVSITRSKSLDTALIEETFPYEKHPGMYSTKVDTTAVRNAIPANTIGRFEKTGNYSVKVK